MISYVRAVALLIAALGFLSLGVDVFIQDLPPLGAHLYFLFPDHFPIWQPAIERHLTPWLWSSIIQPVLERPFWMLLLIIAVLVEIVALLIKKHRRQL